VGQVCVVRAVGRVWGGCVGTKVCKMEVCVGRQVAGVCNNPCGQRRAAGGSVCVCRCGWWWVVVWGGAVVGMGSVWCGVARACVVCGGGACGVCAQRVRGHAVCGVCVRCAWCVVRAACVCAVCVVWCRWWQWCVCAVRRWWEGVAGRQCGGSGSQVVGVCVVRVCGAVCRCAGVAVAGGRQRVRRVVGPPV